MKWNGYTSIELDQYSGCADAQSVLAAGVICGFKRTVFLCPHHASYRGMRDFLHAGPI